MNRSSRRAYSILELVVLIAMLAVLGVLLFPAAPRAGERALGKQCLGQMMELARSLQIYAIENDNHFLWLPAARDGEGEAGQSWVEWLRPYQPQEWDVLHCPAASPDGGATDYSLSGYFASGLATYEFPAPAQTICFAERARGVRHLVHLPWEPGAPYTENDRFRAYLDTRRHLGGANYAFVDLHVEWLPFGKTLAPVNMHCPHDY